MEKGWTQMELASKLGITQGSLSMMETGQMPPSAGVLEGLQKLFPKISNISEVFLPYPEYIARHRGRRP